MAAETERTTPGAAVVSVGLTAKQHEVLAALKHYYEDEDTQETVRRALCVLDTLTNARKASAKIFIAIPGAEGLAEFKLT